MFTITLTEGVTLTATRSTLNRLYSEIDAERREAHAAEVERRLVDLLRTMSPSDPEYSDIYKDVYGVRPHFEWR
jgi:hypothetical protein